MRAPLAGLAIGVLAACSFRAPNAELGDGPREVDASPGDDAPGDGAPFVCDFPDVQCPGGAPLRVLACGAVGECWVGCVNGAAQSPDQAMQFCAGLGMKLGALDSAADETCVRTAGIDGLIMLGITQLAGQLTAADGWVRTADGMPAGYLNWGGGQPNDGLTVLETGEEQCAASNTSSQWHDIPCATVASARWICRRP
jgi:hypothetical protein